MTWLILLVLIGSVGAMALYARSSPKKQGTGRPAPRQPVRLAQPSPRSDLIPDDASSPRQLELETARLLREIDAEVERRKPELDAQAARLHAEAMRHAADAFALEHDDPPVDEEAPRLIRRQDYVGKEDEDRYLGRNDDGLPNLVLVDAGDRLAVWSPVHGGALINPKGTGLRRLGLYASYARGTDHYRSAYRAANLSKGKWIDLVREAENPHDQNAVAMCAPGSRVPFAYVQRGRAPAVARRIDAGEDITAISMRGPASGRIDDSTFVLIGTRSDLEAMVNC